MKHTCIQFVSQIMQSMKKSPAENLSEHPQIIWYLVYYQGFTAHKTELQLDRHLQVSARVIFSVDSTPRVP